MRKAYSLLLSSLILLALGAGTVLAAEGDLPAPQGPTRLYLPLLFKAGPPPEPPSALDSIDAAVAAGKITPAVAVAYRLFAVTADPRLPAEYRGPLTEADAQLAIRIAGRDFPTLPVEIQRQVFPFFQPPGYQGSWYDLRGGPASPPAREGASPEAAPPPFRGDWDSIVTLNGKAKVWWHKSRPMDAEVAHIVSRLLNDAVWDKETKLLGREPISDAGGRETYWDGQTTLIGDSGDGKLDIYLLNCPGCVPAQTVPFPTCTQAPVYIWINSAGARNGVGQVNVKHLEASVSHEFMHALMTSYKYAQPCTDYLKMEEAWGNWAIDDVFPANQTENENINRFKAADYPLFGYLGYEDWVFPYFVTQTYGREVFRKMSDATEQHGPLGAINAGLSMQGGLKEVWHEYALRLWNRVPYDFYKEKNDQPMEAYGSPMTLYIRGANRADTEHEMILGGKQYWRYFLPTRLTGVSNRYFRFTFPDPQVRSLGVFNTFPYVKTVPHDDLKIRALIKIAGRAEWEPVQDWTDRLEKQFCLQLPEERVEEMVLVFSNAQWQAPETPVYLPEGFEFQVVASNIACKAWTGSLTHTYRYQSSFESRTELTTITGMRFERESPTENDGDYAQKYPVRAGNMHWEMSGTQGDCTVRGSGDGVVLPGQGHLWVHNTGPESANIGITAAIGVSSTISPAQLICPTGTSSSQASWGFWGGWGLADAQNPYPRVSQDGLRIQARYTWSVDRETVTTEYNLTAEP